MTESTDLITAALGDVPIVLIARHVAPDDIAARCEAAWAAGVTAIEVTIESAAAVPTLEVAVRHAREHGRPMGAGSIRTVDQLETAVALGVDFLVAPGFAPDVAAAAAARGVPLVPGVATASEITAAVSAGCTLLKAFPASLLTPAWIRAQLAPFPEVQFIATGGVTAGNAQEFLDAGAVAVGIGTSVAVEELAALADTLAGRVARRSAPTETMAQTSPIE